MAGPDDTGKFQPPEPGGQEQRAVELLHALRADRAPDRLRAEIERLRRSPQPRRARLAVPTLGRIPALGLGAAAAAAATVALAIGLAAGGPGASSVLQAAALALRGPVLAAPAPAREAPNMRLDRNVQEIYFPNWGRFGWAASGQRVDRLGRRTAVTVYYAWGGRSIAYTIVSRPAMHEPGGVATTFAGTEFRTMHLHQRVVLTWRRLGHTCVLSGSGVSAQQLLLLAAWHPAGSDY